MEDYENGLTHLDPKGRPRMVDVSGKDHTRRTAVARGEIRMSAEAFQAIVEGNTPKGNVFQVARVAGIQGGKRAGELIPLCHLLPGAALSVALEPDAELPGIRVEAEASISGQTGVEMEALTAASVALLTVYDMAKSLDRGMVMGEVRLVSKSGGKTGTWKEAHSPEMKTRTSSPG